jgi:lysine/ornithine N-monooxygenase
MNFYRIDSNTAINLSLIAYITYGKFHISDSSYYLYIQWANGSDYKSKYDTLEKVKEVFDDIVHEMEIAE